MRRSVLGLSSVGLFLLLANTLHAADDFKAPPAAEREAVAALNKVAARVTVDGEYRVVAVQTSPTTTNAELKHLASCERLATLNISSPKIDDEGVNQLQALSQLTALNISASGISASGVDALRKGMPNCRIFVSSSRGGFGNRGAGPAVGPGPPGNVQGGFGGPTVRSSRPATLARNTAIQDDLKLTPEQRQQISDASTTTALTALMEALDTKVLGVLTEDQKARLKQLELQQQGLNLLTREDIAKQLKLSDEQIAGIAKQNEESAEAFRVAIAELFAQRANGGNAEDLTTKAREKSAEIRKQGEEKVMGLLNDEQKKAWQALLGPKGPEVSTGFSTFGTGDRGRGGPADPVAAAKTVFERYDTDKDGKITDAEFPESNRTRQGMVRAGIMLTFPVAREEFEKSYVKYYQDSRGR